MTTNPTVDKTKKHQYNFVTDLLVKKYINASEYIIGKCIGPLNSYQYNKICDNCERIMTICYENKIIYLNEEKAFRLNHYLVPNFDKNIIFYIRNSFYIKRILNIFYYGRFIDREILTNRKLKKIGKKYPLGSIKNKIKIKSIRKLPSLDNVCILNIISYIKDEIEHFIEKKYLNNVIKYTFDNEDFYRDQYWEEYWEEEHDF
tara:strand:+ start:376 stop:984 length:609 start_codon:yes stop_codon:yes gene_type:complete